MDPQRLVFIDETWIKTSMAPLRQWGPKGERVRGFAPHGHWQTLTFLGALRCDSLIDPCVFHGPINDECFRGARLWYLPPHSPDLNPIEQAFAKIKHWMRFAQKRTIEDTWRFLGHLVTTIQPRECQQLLRKDRICFRQNVKRSRGCLDFGLNEAAAAA